MYATRLKRPCSIAIFDDSNKQFKKINYLDHVLVDRCLFGWHQNSNLYVKRMHFFNIFIFFIVNIFVYQTNGRPEREKNQSGQLDVREKQCICLQFQLSLMNGVHSLLIY